MTLFKSNNLIVNVDLNKPASVLKHKLWNWLEEKHNEVFWDLEMHEGGKIQIMNSEISFWGDNGVLTLDRVDVDTI